MCWLKCWMRKKSVESWALVSCRIVRYSLFLAGHSNLPALALAFFFLFLVYLYAFLRLSQSTLDSPHVLLCRRWARSGKRRRSWRRQTLRLGRKNPCCLKCGKRFRGTTTWGTIVVHPERLRYKVVFVLESSKKTLELLFYFIFSVLSLFVWRVSFLPLTVDDVGYLLLSMRADCCRGWSQESRNLHQSLY